MHKSRAVGHWESRLNLDRQAALAKWDEEEAKARHKLFNGPSDSPLQIPVKLDDFIVVDDSIVDEKVKVKEHKRQKWSDEQNDLMDEGLMNGRGWSSSGDLEKLGVADTNRGRSIFGRSVPLPPPSWSEAGQQAQRDARAEEPPKPAKVKAFDVATERVSLLNKMTTALDKEVESLQAVQRQARELDVDALLASAEATSNEKEAARLLLARLAVCSALLGSYTPGADPPGEDAANKEADEFALALQNQPAELPDLLREAYPLSMVIRKLHEEVRKVMCMKDKKDLEAEMKPILNLVVIMKTSIKSASDKLGKFGKDRMQKEEKQRRSMEIAQQKMLTTEKKTTRAGRAQADQGSGKARTCGQSLRNRLREAGSTFDGPVCDQRC